MRSKLKASHLNLVVARRRDRDIVRVNEKQEELEIMKDVSENIEICSASGDNVDAVEAVPSRGVMLELFIGGDACSAEREGRITQTEFRKPRTFKSLQMLAWSAAETNALFL